MITVSLSSGQSSTKTKFFLDCLTISWRYYNPSTHWELLAIDTVSYSTNFEPSFLHVLHKIFCITKKWTALSSMCLHHPIGLYLIKVNTFHLRLAGLWHCVVLEDMQNACWRWRQQVPTKFLHPNSRLHSDPTHKTTVLRHSQVIILAQLYKTSCMIILCCKTHINLHTFDWISLETAQHASWKLTVCGTPDCRYLRAWYLTI